MFPVKMFSMRREIFSMAIMKEIKKLSKQAEKIISEVMILITAKRRKSKT